MAAARPQAGHARRRNHSRASSAILPAAVLGMVGMNAKSRQATNFSAFGVHPVPGQHALTVAAGSVQSGNAIQSPTLLPFGSMAKANYVGAGIGATALAVVAATLRRTSMRTASVDAPSQTQVQDEEANGKWIARVSLLIMAMLCSTNFSLVKILEDGQSEAAVAAARFAVATIPFLPIIRNHLDSLSIRSGIEIGLWCFIGYYSQAVGLQNTEASHGAFLCSLCMIVVPTAKVLLGEKVPPQIWVSVVLAVVGTAMLIGVGTPSGFHEGDIFCSITALGFGLMFLRMDMYAKEPGFNPVGCTVWQVLTLAVAMVAWLVSSTGPSGAVSEVMSLIASGPQVLPALLWVGLVTTAGVLYVETVAMEEIDGTEAGIIFTTEPVWATLFSSVVLGESLGQSEGIGAVLIIASCLLTQVNFGSTEQKQPIEAV